MAEMARFNFDLDLAQTTRKAKLMEEGDIELLISQAREQGYQEGHTNGENSVLSQSSLRIAAAAEEIAAKGANFLSLLEEAQKHHLVQSTQLAASVGNKLAHHLIDKNPTAEIDALIQDCLTSLGKTAHLVIRCNEQLSDQVQEIAQNHAQQAGYDGRLIIMGEPDIDLGDCRIEWSDGGLARNFSQIEQMANERITQFVNYNEPAIAPIPETEIEIEIEASGENDTPEEAL